MSDELNIPTTEGETMGYLPMMHCPSCRKSWQLDDYYSLSVGSELECPHCEKVAVIVEYETMIHCTLHVKPATSSSLNAAPETP